MALNSNFRTLTADNIEGVSADRNYLKSSFENGQLTGWTEVSVALTSGLPTGTPTISSTAASSLALSATSVTPLSGSRSLLVDVPSALTAGHGFISDEFTIDRMDLGKVLTVTFDYERLTGTYNFSGTLGSQTWMVYIYDATLGAANWIQPAGFLGMNQSSGPGRVACTFQTSVTAGQKYRVAVIASQAASGASSIEFDNFTCSRQTAPIGPVVTDWVSYNLVIGATTTAPTPGTLNVNQARWRRVGDSMEIVYNFEQAGAGTSGSGTYLFPIPSGFSIDTNKLAIMNPARTVVGSAKLSFGLASTGSTTPFGVVIVGTSNPNNLIINYPNTTIEGTNSVGSSGYGLNNPNISFSFEASVPISGWSSNVQLSNDTDTRVVAFAANKTAAQSIPNNSYTVIDFNSVEINTHGSTYAAGAYTAPVSGYYRVGFNFNFASGSGGTIFALLNKNGAGFARVSTQPFASSQSGGTGSTVLYLNAGENVSLSVIQLSGSAQNLEGAGRFSVERISGPSVVAASETVACRYTTVTGQAIPGTGANTLMTGWVKDYDTHNFFGSSGIATVPVSGKYEVSLCAFTNPTAYSTVQTAGAVLYKNGSQVSYIDQRYGNGTTQNLNVSGSDAIQCNAGDTLAVYFYSGGVATTINTTPGANHIVIKRIGN